MYRNYNCYGPGRANKRNLENKKVRTIGYIVVEVMHFITTEDAISCFLFIKIGVNALCFILYLIKTITSILIILTYILFIIDLSGCWHVEPTKMFQKKF